MLTAIEFDNYLSISLQSFWKDPDVSKGLKVEIMAGFKVQIPQHREFTGGDLLAQSLRQLGVKTAFGLHGGHLDAFLMGCEDIGIRLIDTRHETAAVQAAEGYSKVTGEVGTSFVTANSGCVSTTCFYMIYF